MESGFSRMTDSRRAPLQRCPFLLMRASVRFAIHAIVALLFARSLYAQTATPSAPSGSIGVSFQQLVPRSDFRENTRGADPGHQGALGFNLIGHVNSFVALRLDYFFGG